MPPLELVKSYRDSFVETLKDDDPKLHEKKWLLEDLDAIIYNIEQSNGQKETWDEIVALGEQYNKDHPQLRVVK